MKKQDFYKLFADKLQISIELTEDTRLDSINEWDSWAKLDIMSMVDESFNVNLTADDLKEINTIGDLMIKIGEQHFT